MSENKNQRTRGVTLREPKDVRRIVQRVVSASFREGSEVENAGKISQLLTVWLKAWDIEQSSVVMQRLEELVKRYEELCERVLGEDREASLRDPGSAEQAG